MTLKFYRRYQRNDTRTGRTHHRWDLFTRDAAVTFWYEEPYDYALSGLETHTFCDEDADVFPCDMSPTGFCNCDGTSLGGEAAYHRMLRYDHTTDKWGMRDEDVYRELERWYRDRFNCWEDER